MSKCRTRKRVPLLRRILWHLPKLRRFRGFDNLIELAVGRAVFRNTTLQVHRIGAVQMVVDHRYSDAGSLRTCVSSPMYARLLDRVELPCKISVLDVGANVGGFALLLVAREHVFRRLVCVEMNPFTAEGLRFNVLTNFPDVATVVNLAVAARSHVLRLRLGGGSTGDSIYRESSRTTDAKERDVTADTLDSLVGEFAADQVIDLCKIDIEGAEEEVFLGSDFAQTLRRVSVLVIEIHHKRSSQELAEIIMDHGLRWVDGSKRIGDVGQHVFARSHILRAT